MAENDAAAFLERIENDEAFATRIRETGNPERVVEIARSEGFDVDRDAIRDAFIDRYGDRLNEEQLAAVAGGIDETAAVIGMVVLSVVGVVGTFGTGIALAAAVV